MSDDHYLEQDIRQALHNQPPNQTDSQILRRLRQGEEVQTQILLHLLGYAYVIYEEAVKENIHALNAERERLRQAVNQQRRELMRIRDHADDARDFTVDQRVDAMRVTVLQTRRLDEETARLRRT